MIRPRELQEKYARGENISSFLRQQTGSSQNNEEIIELTYDLQAGNYIRLMENPIIAQKKQEYFLAISSVIASCCTPRTVLEAGVGDGTTLSAVMRNVSAADGQYSKCPTDGAFTESVPREIRSGPMVLRPENEPKNHVSGPGVEFYGFDLSWSRAAVAKQMLSGQMQENVTLCTGNLLQIPFGDNAIDVVYTSHSIESNGGREKPILEELYRVTKRFLILVEPGYEFASDEGKQHMEKHGYCRNVRGVAEALGYQVLRHEAFPYSINPLNPSALTVIKKESLEEPAHILACPRFKTPLQDLGGMLYSPEALMVYPILLGIPCLRVENGILASKFPEMVEAFMRK